jgi:hypothetical protein
MLIQSARTKMTEMIDLATRLVTALNAMPYYRNYAAASGASHNISKHEDAIEAELVRHGLTVWTPKKKLSKEQVWGFINAPSTATDMPPMSYMAQPCGTQDKPDFLVKLGKSVVLALEGKSSDTCSPQYNSGGITQNYIYVFCSSKTNKTTTYLGRDILSLEAQRLIDEHIAEARKRDEELKTRLEALDVNHRGVAYYTRPMIIQQGGETYTNYFTHPKRAECEQNVVKFLTEMITNA